MEETIATLKQLLSDSPSTDRVFLRNVLKEYFQILALDFIYSHKQFSKLFFYGGSCLAHCYGLPRLSEDIDFVDTGKVVKLDALAKDLVAYVKKDAGLDIKATCQKFRVYLKFPILRALGLAAVGESDLLFLKVEIFQPAKFCKRFKTEYVPLFKFNRSIIIKTFDLSTLMSTKIRAILLRKWERTDKSGDVVATVKGRDYFDFMWYLEKGITPNLACIPEAESLEDLKDKLLFIVRRVDTKSIRLDLEALIEHKRFVETVSATMKEIIVRGIQKW